MPTLTPETPDGFFMFLMQMDLAQREVEILKQRTSDGMAAKFRMGGWPSKAPEGYVNKERQVRSGKYDRWVEKDPIQGQCIRDAWDMLLTASYTLAEICEELARRGYTRSTGRPWAYVDSQGRYVTLRNRLTQIFHNPFYAGWVYSKKYGIVAGQIRGNWEPIVTTEEFERGVEILSHHDGYRARKTRHSYLLKKLLWVRKGDRLYRLYSSTSRGRHAYYSYYVTWNKVNGKKVHVPARIVEGHIPDWLKSIAVAPEWMPYIREKYYNEIHKVRHDDRNQKLTVLRRRVASLREEEQRLARLYITSKMTEESYNNMRSEWIEKVRQAESDLAILETEATQYLDDLDLALQMLSRVSTLFEHFDLKRRVTLLQILRREL
jgi:site-specific DNA recombinase